MSTKPSFILNCNLSFNINHICFLPSIKIAFKQTFSKGQPLRMIMRKLFEYEYLLQTAVAFDEIAIYRGQDIYLIFN